MLLYFIPVHVLPTGVTAPTPSPLRERSHIAYRAPHSIFPEETLAPGLRHQLRLAPLSQASPATLAHPLPIPVAHPPGCQVSRLSEQLASQRILVTPLTSSLPIPLSAPPSAFLLPFFLDLGLVLIIGDRVPSLLIQTVTRARTKGPTFNTCVCARTGSHTVGWTQLLLLLRATSLPFL